MSKVLCFAIADLDYLDIIKVGLYTYSLHNNQPIKVFVEDGTAEVFRKEIPLACVEFINYDLSKTKCNGFYKDHKDLFSSTYYFWKKDHILNMLSANEILDELIAKYKNNYDVIIRLDLDVLFYDDITKTVDDFIKSNCVIGSIVEAVSSETKIDIPGIDYLNAGSLFFRMNHPNLLVNHTERMLTYIEKAKRIFYFPDQDTLNLMYAHADKFKLNNRGWIVGIYSPDGIKRLSENTVFVHYAGFGKPYQIVNAKAHPLRATYKTYLEAAKLAHCSTEFIGTICQCIQSLQAPAENYAANTILFNVFFRTRNKTKCIISHL